jgi:hypothetical protein
VLSGDELRAVAARFGVAEQQVRRDHLISHVLTVVAGLTSDAVFFGGTALARTHLPDGRLSEDIDLYAASRRDVAATLADEVPRALRREHPGLRWAPAPDAVREPGSGLLVTPTGLAVRVQVLDGSGYAQWDTEIREIVTRYSDLRPVRLRVPTRAAFVGMKTWAWFERRAARDLYDLWALATVGAVDDDAAAAFRRAVGWSPRPELFDRPPDELAWHDALAHQTASLPSAAAAVATVRTAFAAL